jgi:hypothetical protein
MEQTLPTYLIASSKVERNGDLLFLNLGPGGLCLAIGVEHARMLARDMQRLLDRPEVFA